MNAICWHRNLIGDFKEIVDKLELKENITEISIEDLLKLKLSENGHLARDIILKDMQLLTDFGASPILNLLKIISAMKISILFPQMFIHIILIVHQSRLIHFYVLILVQPVTFYPTIKLSKN